MKHAVKEEKPRGTAKDRPHIVTVDDDPDFLFVLRGWLEPRYQMIPFSSGEALLDELPFLEPDLVIMDVRLPGPDGFKLCHRIRSDPRFAGTPILFLTASRDNEDFVRNLDAGGSAWLTKPVDRAQLLKEIRELLAR